MYACNVYTQTGLISVYTLHFYRHVSVRTRSTNTHNSNSIRNHYWSITTAAKAPKCRALILDDAVQHLTAQQIQYKNEIQ